jgi:hypothetical protein
MQASLSRSVIGPAGQAGGGSKQIAESVLVACCSQAWQCGANIDQLCVSLAR